MLSHLRRIDVFMCGFISISTNNKVKKKQHFFYQIDQENGEYKSGYQKYCIFVSMTTSF